MRLLHLTQEWQHFRVRFHVVPPSPESPWRREPEMDHQFRELANHWPLVFWQKAEVDFIRMKICTSILRCCCFLLHSALLLLVKMRERHDCDRKATVMLWVSCSGLWASDFMRTTLWCWWHVCVFFLSGGRQSPERREGRACCSGACEFLTRAARPQKVYSD